MHATSDNYISFLFLVGFGACIHRRLSRDNQASILVHFLSLCARHLRTLISFLNSLSLNLSPLGLTH